MPEVISCPECDKKLRVSDETLGKKVKCPNCSNIFVARAGGAEPPAPPPRRSSAIEPTPTASSRKRPVLTDELEEEDEDRPRRSRRDEEDDDQDFDDRDEEMGRGSSKWQAVRSGVNLVAISMLVSVGVVVVSIIIGIIVGAASAATAGPNFPNQVPGRFNVPAANPGTPISYYAQIIFGMVVSGAYYILNLMGHQKILGIPDRNGVSSRTLALITFIFVCATVGFWLIIQLTALFLGAAVTNWANFSTISGMGWLIFVSYVLYILAFFASGITFLLVLRNICLAFGNRGLAKTVFSFLISACSIAGTGLLILIISFATVGLAFMNVGNGGGVGNAQAASGALIGLFCFGGLLLLASLGLFIWYIILLFQVRGVLDSSYRR